MHGIAGFDGVGGEGFGGFGSFLFEVDKIVCGEGGGGGEVVVSGQGFGFETEVVGNALKVIAGEWPDVRDTIVFEDGVGGEGDFSGELFPRFAAEGLFDVSAFVKLMEVVVFDDLDEFGGVGSIGGITAGLQAMRPFFVVGEFIFEE